MADTLTLTLEPRAVLGKKVKNLRRQGIIPVHMYGQGIESMALQCEAKTLYRALAAAGMNTPISISVPGQDGERLTFVREIQWDPVRGAMLHVDFLHVDVANEITASVPITLIGDSPLSRTIQGASVAQLLREVEVRALPLDVPSELVADLSMIQEPSDVIRVSDLISGDKVVSVTDLEEVVARLEIAQAEEPEGGADAGEDAAAPETEA